MELTLTETLILSEVEGTTGSLRAVSDVDAGLELDAGLEEIKIINKMKRVRR